MRRTAASQLRVNPTCSAPERGRLPTAGGLVLATLVACAACTDEPSPAGPLCERAAVVAALARASAGDTVRLGPCTLEGPFEVPAGARLEGSGAEASTIRNASAQPGVLLHAGEPATTLTGLTVEQGSAAYAVRLEGGSGAAALEGVRVSASLGAGVGVVGVPSARLSDVVIEGPVGMVDVLSIPVEPTWAETATFGLVVDAAGTTAAPVALERVSVRGFAEVGAYLRDSFVRWVGGGSSDNRYVGLLGRGGELSLDGVDLSRTRAGRRIVAFGGVLRDTRVRSTGLSIEDGEGYGLVHDAAQATHDGTAIVGQQEAALWFQHGASAEIVGATITGAALAGIVSVEGSNLVVRDSVVEGTRLATTVDDLYGELHLGDGIQIVGATTATELSGVSLRGNERVGLLIELAGGALTSTTIRGVTVTGSGSGLGAIVQGGVAPASWDEEIVRDDVTAANDAALADPLTFSSARASGLPPAYPTPCD